MAIASATAALITMAKRNSKRNRGGGLGGGSGSRKGGDGSGNFGGKPNFCRRHHHFRRHRMDACSRYSLLAVCWNVFFKLILFNIIVNLVKDIDIGVFVDQ